MERRAWQIAVALSSLLSPVSVGDDVATVRLSFEKMHCEECRGALEASLKLLKDVKQAAVDGAVATVTVAEGSVPDLAKLRRAVPTDLKLRSVDLTARGTVAAAKDGLAFTPRGASRGIRLVNPEETPKPEDDRIAQLRQALGGRNRFEIGGEWRDDGKAGERLAVRTFKQVDWKE